MYKMYIAWALCTCWFTLALAEPPLPFALENAETELFEEFVTTYSKTYADDQERVSRLEIFKNNLEMVKNLNLERNDDIFGITEWMDLTSAEFSNLVSCVPLNGTEVEDLEGNVNVTLPKCNILTDKDISAKGAPNAFDWRAQGAVTKVRDQTVVCGCCYAFAAVGHLEARHFMKTKQLVELSPQQIVDCDKLSSGCHGGYIHDSFRSLIDLGGSMSEADYPYKPIMIKPCQSDKKKAIAKLKRCFRYDLKSQEKVKQLLHSVGPIGIVVKFEGFQSYKKGIIPDTSCNKGGLTHAVLLVGYGTENGQDYWIVKNSYGTKFGESGYFRMMRGERAQSCGMMNNLMTTADLQ